MVGFECCFTSTETAVFWGWEPRTATSTFTRLLSSESGKDNRRQNIAVAEWPIISEFRSGVKAEVAVLGFPS